MYTRLVRALSCAILFELAALIVAAPAPAAAADKNALVPAVLLVDMQQVLRASKAGKGVQATLGQEQQSFSKEVARQEDDLQRLNAELQRQRTVLSASAYDAKVKAFQQRYQEIDRAAQAKRTAIQKAFYEASQKIEEAARQIVSDVAKERGANLVLLKQVVLQGPDTADITEEVVERLDKKLASVPITLPKTEAAVPRTRRERSSKRERERDAPPPLPSPQPQLQLPSQQ